MSIFHYDKDVDGIVTLTMDMPASDNAMNEEFTMAFLGCVERLEQESGLAGVVLTSAQKTFFVGGSVNALARAEKNETETFFKTNLLIKWIMRRFEQLPVPKAAAVNGSALGVGYELCMLCNYRIAWRDESVLIGLPEVSMGLLPGGGGAVRLVWMLGLARALPYLLLGTRACPTKALAGGLIDETVDSLEELVPRAKSWIREHRGDVSAAQNLWDKKGASLPGGHLPHPAVAEAATCTAICLFNTTRGRQPAPEHILHSATEAARVDFETALKVEARHFTYLVTTLQAKEAIARFFAGHREKT